MKVACWRFIVPAVLLVSRSVAADEFDDYRIPAHELIDWRLQLQSSGFRSIQTDPSSDRKLRAVSGTAASAFSWLSDSDPMTTEVFVQGAARGQVEWLHQHQTDSFVPSERFTESEDRRASENWFAGIEHRRYPFPVPIGGAVRISASGSYTQSWVHDHSDLVSVVDTVTTQDLAHQAQTIWAYSTMISSQLTIGVGQVRDASSIYEARVLEKRLLETSALARPLSDGARQKLVALLTTRFAYEVLRESPAKLLWQKIEEILAEDGALGERGLDPYSVLRAGERHTGGGLTRDDLPLSPFIRRVGFFAGPALLDQHSTLVARIDNSDFHQIIVDGSVIGPFISEFSSRLESKRDETFVGLSGEYYRPIGLRWQADLSADVFLPTRGSMDGSMGSAFTRVSGMVADHWEASAFAQYERTFLEQASQVDDIWRWIYGASATWYLQDRLQLTLSAQEQQDNRNQAFGQDYFRNGVFSVALTYRILGGFGAPGLIPREAL